MSKRKLLLTAFIFCLMLAFLPFVPAQQASAKQTTPIYVKGNIYLYNRKSKTVNLKNVKLKKKVIWRSTDKKVARVVKTAGKYGQKATIKPGKSGYCEIYTNVNGKCYAYNIMVYKANYKKGKTKIVVTKTDFSKDRRKLTLEYRMCNGTSKFMMSHGESFFIQKQEAGKWVEVPMKDDNIVFNCMAYSVPPKVYKSETLPLESFYDLSHFTAGKYRLVKSFGRNDKNYYAVFTIK